jgi:hypothetical protein
MKMVDKVSFAIDRVEPGSIRTLRLQNKVKVAFSDVPKPKVIKIDAGARQHKGTVGTRINHTSVVKRRVGTRG